MNLRKFYIGSGVHVQDRGYYKDTLVRGGTGKSPPYPPKEYYYQKISYTYLVIPVILQYNIFQKRTRLIVELAFQNKFRHNTKQTEFILKNNEVYSKNISNTKVYFLSYPDSPDPLMDISTSLLYSFSFNKNKSLGLKVTYTHFLFAFQSSYIHPFKTLGVGLNYSF